MRPLSPLERELIAKYTGERAEDIDARRSQFVSEKRFLTISIVPGGVAQVTCAVGLSATVVAFIAQILTSPLPEPTRSATNVTITLIGAGVGGWIRSRQLVEKYIVQIERSSEYLRWRAEAVQRRVLPLFPESLRQLEEAQEFVCPITHQLIVVPMRGGDDRVYEAEAIQEWLRMKEEDLAQRGPRMSQAEREAFEANISPVRGRMFRSSDLEFDHRYHPRVFEAVRRVFNQGVDQEVRAFIERYQNAVRQTREEIARSLGADLVRRLVSREITRAVFDAQIGDLERISKLDPI